MFANSIAETSGNGGSASGTAVTSSGLIDFVTAVASAPTATDAYASAAALAGSAATGPAELQANAYALAGALAEYGTLGPNVGAVFNAPATVDFGTGALGAEYNQNAAGAVTYTSSIGYEINPATLPAGTLDLGLVNDTVNGSGFTDLTFKVAVNGATLIDQNFTTVAAADTYFTDDLQNLGPWAAPDSDLEVTVSLTATLLGAGNGYGVDFTLGVAPAGAAGHASGYWTEPPGLHTLDGDPGASGFVPPVPADAALPRPEETAFRAGDMLAVISYDPLVILPGHAVW
jgi:hypothetical protein